MQVRNECPEDIAAIRDVTAAAFALVPHSSGAEPRIIDALRDTGALTLSLVAERHGAVIGQLTFSPVRIDGKPDDWYGLGPVAVAPPFMSLGIGKTLIEAGLSRLRELDASGCVVLGDPRYYGRFGFVRDRHLTYAGGPPEAFQRLVLKGESPRGAVTYHRAFDIT